MGTQTTRLNNSRDVANVWITSGTTKLILSKNFSGCMVSTKMDTDSRPGASTACQRQSTPTKCDIFATLYHNYKGKFDPLVLKFIKLSRKQAVDGRNYGKVLKYIPKQSTKRSTTIFFHGRLLQFLAVFMHFARTHNFLKFIYRGRPNSH